MEFATAVDGVLVRHPGQPDLTWDVSVFDRTRLSGLEDPFLDINQYIATLPLSHHVELYTAYKHIHDHISDIYVMERLLTLLIPWVAKIYDVLQYDKVLMWMSINGKISYPNSIRDEYDPDDMCRARTYLREDYKGLVVLTAMMRPMVPVFGAYIANAPGPGSHFKEYVAMQLLSKASIIESPAILRLEAFIEAWVRDAPGIESVVIRGGLSSLEVPEWIKGLVLVRRISVGEIVANRVDANGKQQGDIITNIFSYISGIIQQLEDKFGKVKDKRPEGKREEGDEESTLEGYKLKQAQAFGDIAPIREYGKNPWHMVIDIEPNASLQLFETIAYEMDDLLNADIPDFQKHLASWVLDSVIFAQSVENLPKTNLVNCLIATKTLLLTWGFFDLAMLSTALAAPLHLMDIDIPGPKGRMSPAVIDGLKILYPYETGGNNPAKRNNLSAIAISRMVKMIASGRWLVKLPPDSGIDPSQYMTPRGIMYLPGKLSEQLGQMILHLGEVGKAAMIDVA